MQNVIPAPYFVFVLIVLAFSIGAIVALRMRKVTVPSVFPMLSAITVIVLLLMLFSPLLILSFGKPRTVLPNHTYYERFKDPFPALKVGLLTKVEAQAFFPGGLIRGVDKDYLHLCLPEIKDYDEKTDAIVWFRGFVPREAKCLGSEAYIHGVETNEELFVFCVFPGEAFRSIQNLTECVVAK
jgi:hypothetical protein